MAKKASTTTSKKTSPNGQVEGRVVPVGDIRHPAAKRKNNPPAKIASEGTVPVIAKAEYAYNPHLPPVLRFDQRGGPDTLPDLIAEAGSRPLTPEEQRLLAEALRKNEPWLEWTGKRERLAFTVDPVALHIHERVSRVLGAAGGAWPRSWYQPPATGRGRTPVHLPNPGSVNQRTAIANPTGGPDSTV